jgi:AcrR family transcriptional regulator
LPGEIVEKAHALQTYDLYPRAETFKLFFVSTVFIGYICARLKNKQLGILLEKSGELFKKYGIKNLTMDDVAKELGISKKTIYHFVENKAQLVQLTMQNYLEEEQKQLEAILKSSQNSVDEMIQMISYFFNQVRDFNPSALNDLQKYYPQTWDIYNNYRFHFMLTSIAENLENGIKQGVYRNDLNADVISRIYIAGIDILINQDFFPAKKYVFIDTYKEYLNYHLRGIVSAKGLKYLEEHNLFKA